jgi:tripartite-type tricarboxylate transporter receptor subunit TctC
MNLVLKLLFLPLAFISSVQAQDGYRIVSPFPAGGPVDGLARIIATGLSDKYKQSAIVENLVGAAGNIGMDKVKRAAPDGRTLLVIPAGNLTINPTLMANFPFNIANDFVPITMLAKAPNVLVAGAQVPVSNARELIAFAKSKPGTLSFASPGVGSGLHLAGELFNSQTGTDMLHIPYKGTPPAINDLLGGAVPLMFSNLPTVLVHIQSGKLKAIGITDTVRAESAPSIPTLAEQGIAGVVVTSWYALLSPRGTPSAVAFQLSKDAAEILNRPAIREQLKTQALTVWTMQPGELQAHIEAEAASWARIIKAKNIKTE